MKPDQDITDTRLVKALAHPLRMKILSALDESEASPSELAEVLDAPLGNVSYHVRILASLGLIELIKTTPRRGSVEHTYAAVARPVISDDSWANVPEAVKRAMVGSLLEQSSKDVRSAALGGGFNRPEAHLSRTPLTLDDEGWQQLAKAMHDFLKQIDGIEHEASERVAKKGETPRSALALLMFFEAGSSG